MHCDPETCGKMFWVDPSKIEKVIAFNEGKGKEIEAQYIKGFGDMIQPSLNVAAHANKFNAYGTGVDPHNPNVNNNTTQGWYDRRWCRWT